MDLLSVIIIIAIGWWVKVKFFGKKSVDVDNDVRRPFGNYEGAVTLSRREDKEYEKIREEFELNYGKYYPAIIYIPERDRYEVAINEAMGMDQSEFERALPAIGKMLGKDFIICFPNFGPNRLYYGSHILIECDEKTNMKPLDCMMEKSWAKVDERDAEERRIGSTDEGRGQSEEGTYWTVSGREIYAFLDLCDEWGLKKKNEPRAASQSKYEYPYPVIRTSDNALLLSSADGIVDFEEKVSSAMSEISAVFGIEFVRITKLSDDEDDEWVLEPA